MNLIQRIRDFAGLSETQKVQLDRRAFLRGMAVTGAGLLVPQSAVFDMGRRVIPATPWENELIRYYLGSRRRWKEVSPQWGLYTAPFQPDRMALAR